MKKLTLLILFLLSLMLVPKTFAQGPSFVSIVNPVRGTDFLDIKDQDVETAVFGQIDILNKANLPATWLLRFDALGKEGVVNQLKNRPSDEKGLFLEVTPTWATQARVQYQKSNIWHAAGSAFLTGYERAGREKLIDAAFEKFKEVFDVYPVSVGAWWIDSYSLEYMQKKYKIISALIVADQYSTDNYQIWGQYFGTPYYPAKGNALHPAQSLENKLDVVITQWASRDPVNGYGNGVMESTFSLQANDYMDFHNLDTKYFSSLIDVYAEQKFNQFSQIVVGLENSYSWSKYSDEYQKQIKVLVEKKAASELSVVPLGEFAKWYKQAFPKLSPAQIIIADDPLGSYKKAIWFMNPYYRAGWFINEDGGVFRDIRQYVDGQEELCFKTRCDSVNFATSATRVLDEVSFGHKWVIDEGKIADLKVVKDAEKIVLNYRNEGGNLREIAFLPRDISVDGKIFSIDGAILDATKKENIAPKENITINSSLQWSFVSVGFKIGGFLVFLVFVVIIPGLILTNKLFGKDEPVFLRLFVSLVAGFVTLVSFFYIVNLIQIKSLIYVYILFNLIVFIHLKLYKLQFNLPKIKNRLDLGIVISILAGVIFQTVPVFKSGLNFTYGIGLWGPNTHDGVWHMALINQLVKSVPPENPVYSGVILKNYHFFYDLLVASTSYLSRLPVSDLLFRFYPVVFSLMLGIGSFYLVMRFFKDRISEVRVKIAVISGLYLIYFAGSFGWIVEFLRERHFGGESAFWANQAISFNLNPPFAISLVIVIALLLVLFTSSRQKNYFLAILLAGTLIGFKSYGAILILASLILVGILKRKLPYVVIFIGASLVTVLIFLFNFDATVNLLMFAPFWFIHSMVDSPDRVGWVRLSLAREAGFEKRNWFKFISAEILSLLIFIAGNLGLRVFALLSLIKIKNIIKDDSFLFILIFVSLSFLIPILFVQSGNPWNTIQFSYYGLYITALVAGIVISSLVVRFPKYISVLIVFMVLIFAPINSIMTASGYFGSKPHAFVSDKEISGLQFLSGQPEGVVLTYPYDGKLKQQLPEPWPILAYDSTAYVSAFSKKAVYLEDEGQNQILLTDYKKRLVASRDFFLKPTDKGAKFLYDNKIKYVYIPKLFKTRLEEDTDVIKNIFENEEVVIYKVN